MPSLTIPTLSWSTSAPATRDHGRKIRACPRAYDLLYAASIVAVDVNTGLYRWHYQNVPGDEWDFDSVQHLLLADVTIKGVKRKVIMQANKNGFLYTHRPDQRQIYFG